MSKSNNDETENVKIAVVLCANRLKTSTISLLLEELFKGSPVKIIFTGNQGFVCRARIIEDPENKDAFKKELKECGIQEKTVDVFIFEGCPIGPLINPPDHTPTIEILHKFLKKDGIIVSGNHKLSILPPINTKNLILIESKHYHVKEYPDNIPIRSGIKNHIYYYHSQREGNYMFYNEKPYMSYAHIYKFKKASSSKSSNKNSSKSSSQEKSDSFTEGGKKTVKKTVKKKTVIKK